jgi:S-adenosylmethionine decarboxylase proenzyme
MFSNTNTSGKHMICDIKNIKNITLLNDDQLLIKLLDNVCELHNFTILNKSFHKFPTYGFSSIYLLSESHISIHTFPEKKYVAIDIYTCRQYDNNNIYYEIYNYLIQQFQATMENPIIIDRLF